MRHEVVQDTATFQALEQDWADLLVRSGRNFLPMSHFWTAIWWKNFGNGQPAKVHCFYNDENKLIAVAPMLLESTKYRRVPIQRLASMANGHSPFSELLVDQNLGEGQLTEIVARIVGTSKADLTTFILVPQDSPLYRLLHGRSSVRYHSVGTKESFSTPVIKIDSDWDTFFSKRSQKFRKGIRSKVNRFARTEGCSIERRQVTSPNDPIMDEMLQVSRNSWKGKVGKDLSTIPGSLSFMQDLIEKLGHTGGIQIWIARSGKQPIAYEFHAQYQGVTYPLRADFDESFRELSPGSVVEYAALHDLFNERQLALYDSCALNYWYLSNWTSDHRAHIDIEIFSDALKSKLLHATEYKLIPALQYCRDKLQKLRPNGSASTEPTTSTKTA